jgi:hypothetical protein
MQTNKSSNKSSNKFPKKLWGLIIGSITLGIILFAQFGFANLLQGQIPQASSSPTMSKNSPHRPSSSPLATPSVTYQVETLPQAVIYLLTIPSSPQFVVKIKVAEDLQTLPRFATDQDGTIALLNAGFFDPQNQLTTSFVTSQGQLVADPRQNPRLMGNPQLADYLDQILDRSEFRLYMCGQAQRYAITSHSQPIPNDCQLTEAVGGGPQLLPELTAREEGFLTTENGVVIRDAIGLNQPNARTAVGIKANGDLIWVMVAQKPENPRNSGLSLPDLAKFMAAKGVVQALNLDGGSSSSFYYQGQTFYGRIDAEGNRIQRPVKSVLMLQSTN